MRLLRNPLHRIGQNKAASLIEYIVLAMLVAGALYTMNSRLLSGLGAKHRSMGEVFSYGRQYDNKRTISCRQDVEIDDDGNPKFDSGGVAKMGVKYDENCFQTRVIRPAELDGSGHWKKSGGCPQCFPQDIECFKCEDAIKKDCQSAYCASQP